VIQASPNTKGDLISKIIWWKYYEYMYANGKMRPAETPGIGWGE
jgi:hypothetical protein